MKFGMAVERIILTCLVIFSSEVFGYYTGGQLFYLVFMAPQPAGTSGAAIRPVELLVMSEQSDETASLTITSPTGSPALNLKITVPPLTTRRIVLPTGPGSDFTDFHFEGQSPTDQKVLKIQSDRDILVSGRDRSAGNETVTILPWPTLGRRYIVPCWHTGTYCQAAIISGAIATTVKVKVMGTTAKLNYNGNQFATGSTFNVTLLPEHAVALRGTKSDLLGLVIESIDHPVAVFSGSSSVNSANNYQGTTVVQLVQPKYMDKQYIVAPFDMKESSASLLRTSPPTAGNLNFQVSRTMPGRPNVSSAITIAEPQGSTVYALIPPGSVFLISSSEAFSVVQDVSCNDGHLGDPTQFIVPSVEEYRNEYVFVSLLEDSWTYRKNTLFLAMHASDTFTGMVGKNLELNGTPLTDLYNITWLTLGDISTKYKVAYVDVSCNYCHLMHVEGALFYAVMNSQAVTDTITTTVSAIKTNCHLSAGADSFQPGETVSGHQPRTGADATNLTPEISSTPKGPLPDGSGTAGGLSQGAIIGISAGAGVVVIVIIVVVIIVIFLWRRKNRGASTSYQEEGHANYKTKQKSLESFRSQPNDYNGPPLAKRPDPDIVEFLSRLGLVEYAGRFAQEEITVNDLARLSESDLEKMGIPLGPRKRIHDKIKDMHEYTYIEVDKDAGDDAYISPVPTPDYDAGEQYDQLKTAGGERYEELNKSKLNRTDTVQTKYEELH